MFPEVESAWAQVQELVLGVIVPGVVGLFIAVLTIVMAFRWVHKASREGRHAGGSWEGASAYAAAHFDDEDAGSGGLPWSDAEEAEWQRDMADLRDMDEAGY